MNPSQLASLSAKEKYQYTNSFCNSNSATQAYKKKIIYHLILAGTGRAAERFLDLLAVPLVLDHLILAARAVRSAEWFLDLLAVLLVLT